MRVPELSFRGQFEQLFRPFDRLAGGDLRHAQLHLGEVLDADEGQSSISFFSSAGLLEAVISSSSAAISFSTSMRGKRVSPFLTASAADSTPHLPALSQVSSSGRAPSVRLLSGRSPA